MESVKDRKIPKATKILNILGIVMVGVSLFSIYNSQRYISGLIMQGLDLSKQLPEVINYYISSITPNIFYSICLFSMGYIIKEVNNLANTNNRIEDKKTYGELVEEKQEEEDIVDVLLKERKGYSK